MSTDITTFRFPVSNHDVRTLIIDDEPWFVARDFKYEHRLGPAVLENAVKELNSSESWRLRELAKQADQYVAWQQARIKDWKPSELKPVEDK